ncbi:hypothetical protein [Modestobacter italicus]|uniref:hypothetical protein n=1 Tax=Modestobacter italicus (strain DSM 44449 / CECT 9708 / BC 501) TaxID=2732864 RepID=UPI001C9670E7|nr:hypothetical protein [Modestobacter italicus]
MTDRGTRVFEWEVDDGPPEVQRPARGTRPAPGWTTAVLVAVAVAWLLLTGWQWLQWAGAVADLATPDLTDWWPDGSAEPVADPARAEAQHHGRLAVLFGTAVPGFGLVVALLLRRRLPAVVFGGGAVLGLCLGLWMQAVVTPDVPELEPRHCQEHSGGDATCPGG